ncbi:major facilitator super domain-containing protein 3 [Aspergillus niger]|nr:major facilitator super domain-containing protein 3 [Aspergillus niger]GLA33813.1 major facilitator super domain-containing protein 3 [Aspergillus niger]
MVIGIHLLSGIPFEAHDSATNLKLLELGFKEADLALVSVIDLLLDILSTYLTGLLCARMDPMRLWCWAKSSLSLAMVIMEHAGSTGTATIMFVSFLTLHLRVSDPKIGSTYMTLLAT